MTARRRTLASRTNGFKSSGPKTVKGKRQPCRNALRHGLNLINKCNPAFADKIELIAKRICEGCNDPLLYEEALTIAECDVTLWQARCHTMTLLSRFSDPLARPSAEWNREFKERAAAFDARFKEVKAIDACYPQPGQRSSCPPNELERRWAAYWIRNDRDDCAAAFDALPDLVRIHRYERRAWSRRRRAFQRYLIIKSGIKSV